MKTIILTLAGILISASSAQASFYSISCSTASGETTHVMGHINKTVVTKYTHKPTWSEERIDMTGNDVRFEELAEQNLLDSYSSNKCGIAEWGKTYTVKAMLFLESGVFEDTIGGAKDGVIEDFFICEEYGNSMAMSDPNDPDCN